MKAWFVLAAALFLAAPAAADSIDSDPGAHLLHDYVLTMPKLLAYDAAYKAMTTAAKSDPKLKSDIAAASSENDQTIAATIGKMDHFPRVYAFFQKQGLSKMEAATLPIILASACMVAQYPDAMKTMAKLTSPAQVAFCKTNMKAVQGLGFMHS